ncbi:MAG TPA: OB-fold nucleic acid binding domain-containing protein, partial [Candidatus Limnocylindrales bacterium]|nr:OB-fold nucleic acid binding domain-containing protein [Candidatus Limnocylindrales bacterium]
RFVSQAAERGVEPHVIDAVFKAFEPFERYGFNKAHATCYGLIAYQTAYLKANYTVEYMTSVLTAFRSNEEKVAAAIAECRRMGIEVLPPDVHRSGVEFTVEGQAIRFGLLAVKNVGQGAIESIIAARTEGGPFRSLADFCARVDLRLANRKVLESLARVGALNALGHPAQILLGLDDAMAAGQAAQRDRLTGQTSLFDLGAEDATAMERPLPQTTEVPVRERLRWEKELLGLYLSEHPMGEVAEQVGAFVTAYSGDLKDESLDGQRIVVAGIVTGFRTIITKAKSTMGVATLEDLQGTIEIVVFPKMYEMTAGTWTDGTILLVAGRVDHRGEEVSLLADLVLDWDAALARGPEAIAREVAAGDRGRAPRRPPPSPQMPSTASVRPVTYANGNGHDDGHDNGGGPGSGPGSDQPPAAASSAGADSPPVIGRTAGGREIVHVSPLRAEAQSAAATPSLPGITPGAPIPTYLEPPGLERIAPDRDVEPALPDEARSQAAEAADAATPPVDAAPDATLHVRFAGGAATDRVVGAMEAFKGLLVERPGSTRVVLHVPAPTGAGSLPMELRRGVAYDAELLAEVRRRLGEGIVELRLA